MSHVEKKLSELYRYMRRLRRAVVAFSGGVDSTLLLKVALDSLGTANVLAVTLKSPLMPQRDIVSAEKMASELGALHRIIEADILQESRVAENSPQRCYFCKRRMFELVTDVARREGYDDVLEGSNSSDMLDYRPGFAAIRELGTVRSPLLDCGIEKEEVRQMAKALGLKNWGMPARPCLATRIPYGEPISREKLRMVECAEERLAELGFDNARVRHHGAVARIELPAQEMPRFLNMELLRQVSRLVKSCGFTYVALDMDGYRMGSCNEAIGM